MVLFHTHSGCGNSRSCKVVWECFLRCPSVPVISRRTTSPTSFENLTAQGRKHTTEVFHRFVATLAQVLRDYLQSDPANQESGEDKLPSI